MSSVPAGRPDAICAGDPQPEPEPAGARARLLALGPHDVYPATDGGRESIFGALGALAAHADLTYAYPCVGDSPGLEIYRARGLRPLPIDYATREGPALMLSATLRGQPYKFAKYWRTAHVRKLLAAIDLHEFDAILCFHAHLFGLGWRLARAANWHGPIILREHNLEYGVVDSYVASLPAWAKPAGRIMSWLTRREEHMAWRRADAVAFISDADLDAARATGVPGRFLLAPEGTPLPVLDPPAQLAPRVVFLCNPKAIQSAHNARRFVQDCWLPAKAAGRLRGLGLAITGVDPAGLESLAGVSVPRQTETGIEAVGFVDALAPLLQGSLAMVSPSYVGGGIRKKILEGMAHGLPVIATPLDIESSRLFVADENILAFDGGPQSFSDVFEALQANPARRAQLAAAARASIEREATWAHFGQVMSAMIRAAIDQRRGFTNMSDS
ncbi:MAG: glycosyltransferase [Burkholderiaceae bacterium]